MTPSDERETPDASAVAADRTTSGLARREVVAWIAVPAIGAMWAIHWLERSYFFYDEWSMIGRVMRLPLWTGMTRSFNGHLWFFQDWLYRIQVAWFGVDSHLFVCVVFVLSLVALHVSISAVLKCVGVPVFMSLLAGGLLTYLGAAAQNFIFAIQSSPTLSLAVGLSAAALALSGPPTKARCVLAGTAMLLSVAFDSATALCAIMFSSVVLALVWRWRYALVALPSVLVVAWWYLTADLGPVDHATLAVKARFAVHLLLRSLGALFGRGELLGAVLLAVIVLVVVVGLSKGWVTPQARAALTGGALSTAVTTAAIAHSRATIVGTNFFDYNRYLQNVLVPFSLSALPAVYSSIRGLAATGPRPRRAGAGRAVGPMIVAGAFVLGLSPLHAYVKNFEAWNVAVRHGVRDAAALITIGCPTGAPPDPTSQPVGDLSPQITTRLLQELLRRGALRPSHDTHVDPAVLDRMCPQTSSSNMG